VGPSGNFTGVQGMLAPDVAGQSVEITYVPVDKAAKTISHTVSTGARGQFSDAAGASFKSATAVFAGDGTYTASGASCP
jgi:hypothetical protein